MQYLSHPAPRFPVLFEGGRDVPQAKTASPKPPPWEELRGVWDCAGRLEGGGTSSSYCGRGPKECECSGKGGLIVGRVI